MADKDIQQPQGWKQRMLQLASGIFAPYVAHLSANAAATSNVNGSASSVTLKAANAARRGLLVHNDADKDLYLKYGATASTTSFTVKILAGGYWEMPFPIYAGVVDGIWASGPTGAARVTELT